MPQASGLLPGDLAFLFETILGLSVPGLQELFANLCYLPTLNPVLA